MSSNFDDWLMVSGHLLDFKMYLLRSGSEHVFVLFSNAPVPRLNTLIRRGDEPGRDGAGRAGVKPRSVDNQFEISNAPEPVNEFNKNIQAQCV